METLFWLTLAEACGLPQTNQQYIRPTKFRLRHTRSTRGAAWHPLPTLHRYQASSLSLVGHLANGWAAGKSPALLFKQVLRLDGADDFPMRARKRKTAQLFQSTPAMVPNDWCAVANGCTAKHVEVDSVTRDCVIEGTERLNCTSMETKTSSRELQDI